MKKKLRLKKWVKDVLIFTIGIIVIYGVSNIYTNKIEKINNGEITIQYAEE